MQTGFSCPSRSTVAVMRACSPPSTGFTSSSSVLIRRFRIGDGWLLELLGFLERLAGLHVGFAQTFARLLFLPA
jgi:hypothetical protein